MNLPATREQKAAAFEWLRARALDESNPHSFAACVLLQELVDLNAQGISQASRDVIAERVRQIKVEGWDSKHDDEHDAGDLASAGACYAVEAACKLSPYDGLGTEGRTLPWWPWNSKWWKPKDPRRDLVRAAALIIAEIERIDRPTLRGKVT